VSIAENLLTTLPAVPRRAWKSAGMITEINKNETVKRRLKKNNKSSREKDFAALQTQKGKQK
jgi:hypothetical protein